MSSDNATEQMNDTPVGLRDAADEFARQAWEINVTDEERIKRKDEALREALDAIQGYVDVKDGSDGPRPNWAMQLSQTISEALAA